MAREITQRELRNDSGGVMRALDTGQSFIVTRNGVPVGELTPLRGHRLVARDAVLAIFARSGPIDAVRFRLDVDAILDQDPSPRD